MQTTDVLDARLAARLDPLLDLRIIVGDRSHAGGGAGKKNQTRGGEGGLGQILRPWRRKRVFLLPQIDSQPADPVVDVKIPLPTRVQFNHRFPPQVILDLDDETVPDPMRHFNWIRLLDPELLMLSLPPCRHHPAWLRDASSASPT